MKTLTAWIVLCCFVGCGGDGDDEFTCIVNDSFNLQIQDDKSFLPELESEANSNDLEVNVSSGDITVCGIKANVDAAIENINQDSLLSRVIETGRVEEL